jgi:hypothetical protein
VSGVEGLPSIAMLDQSDGSVSTVQRALFRPWMTLQDQQLAEEE